MKLKNSYLYQGFRNYIETQSFVFLFFLSIIFAAFGTIQCVNYSYTTSLILAYNNTFYLTGQLLLFFANTKNTYDYYKKNYEYIIRCKTKGNLLKQLIKSILFNNIVLLIINILLMLIFLNLFCTNNNTLLLKNYNITHVVYLIFCIIKFILLVNIISIINVCLFQKLSSKLTTCANIVFAIIIHIIPTNYYNISSVINMPWSITAYLIGINSEYSSFIFECLCFVIYFMTLSILTLILIKKTISSRKDF